MNEPSPARSDPAPREKLLGRRIFAGLLDLAVLFVIGLVMTLLLGDVTTDGGTFDAELSGLPFVLFVIVSFGYYWLMESAGGQTLGKMALGIRVAALDGDASAGKILVRTLMRFIDGFAFYLIAVLVIAISGKHQRLGDMLAGTTVVRASRPSPRRIPGRTPAARFTITAVSLTMSSC